VKSRPHPVPSTRSRNQATLLVLTLAVSLVAARSPAAEPEKPAEQAFKNIKVLTGVPASQLMPVMQLMGASLGKGCDFCHVMEGHRFDLDTKEEKGTARDMIRMVLSINKQNFEGHTAVTCNTCHRGSEHPVRTPPIGQPRLAEMPHGAAPQDHHEHGAEREKLPSAVEVLDRYLQALGGRAALEEVKSRVSRGTLLHMKMAAAGTPQEHPVNRGQKDPLEIVQQAPDYVTVTVGPPAQAMVQKLEGAAGTVKGPQGERPMTPQEVTILAAQTDLRKDLKLRDRAEKARVVGKEAIDGKDALVVRMNGEDGTSQTLYFDAGTGLLRRQIINRPTLVGAIPEQVDFADYRGVVGGGGVKVPFSVKLTYLDDDYRGTTQKLVEVKDKRF